MAATPSRPIERASSATSASTSVKPRARPVEQGIVIRLGMARSLAGNFGGRDGAHHRDRDLILAHGAGGAARRLQVEGQNRKTNVDAACIVLHGLCASGIHLYRRGRAANR